MGLFSFLTGQKDEAQVTDAVKAPEAPKTAAPAKAPESSTGVATASPEGVAPHVDTPFTPPEAWNTDALTAPPPESSGEKPQVGATDPAVTAELQPAIVAAIKTVYDPEIPVDIYELGLIYEIIADADRNVLINMTLTSPACPSAQQIPSEVRYKVKALPGVTNAWVEIVWDPPWGKERMSEEAKLALGLF